MQDLAAFNVVRPPRRAEPTDMEHLPLAGPLVDAVGMKLDSGVGVADPAVQQLLSDFEKMHHDPLKYLDARVKPVLPDSERKPLEKLTIVSELDRWLVQEDDRPSAADLILELKRLGLLYDSAVTVQAVLEEAKAPYELLAEWLLFWSIKSDMASATRGTRLALVIALSSIDAKALQAAKPAGIWALLHARPPIFARPVVSAFAKARVDLVRAATVADLHVVRSEWRGYVPGEIALIRNVMVGETLSNTLKELSETETTTAKETDTTTSQQSRSQQEDQSDLSREVQNSLQVAIHGSVQAQYEQTGPGNKLTVNAGAEAGVQVGRNESFATKIARKALNEAISLVETKTRESRATRHLVRSEETTTHTLNGPADGARGVYRWVDRIDRYQVFTYPDRLQLEFQLPLPSEYYRARIRQLTDQASTQAPPLWTVKKADITADNALQLAATYHGVNLPPCPDDTAGVVVSFSTEPAAVPDKLDTTIYKSPAILKDVEIKVPEGYRATKVFYAGFATPLRAKWQREYSGANKPDGGEDVVTFHTILANISVGSHCDTYCQPGGGVGLGGGGAAGANTIQGQVDHVWTQYGDSGLGFKSAVDGVDVDASADNPLMVGVSVLGADSVTVSFEVTCSLTEKARQDWRNSVYDALFTAWSDWNKAYQSAQSRGSLTGALPIGEQAPERNAVVVRDELKRQVVAWLLANDSFGGFDEFQVPADKTKWRDPDFAKARADAPTIQFLEQALEWGNMMYMFYPYYWANRNTDWDTLNAVTAVDAVFERFLKAGSARVVVPVRPGMEAAVNHWLMYQQPFLGQPLPLPGHPTYVSIATEIRDLTMPIEGGIPGESWESRMGTTLVWLDTSEELPANPIARLGAAPNEPGDILYPPS